MIFSSWLRTLGRWLFLMMLLILAGAAFIVTPVGLKIGLAIFSETVPGHLDYRQVKGGILGPLSIQHLNYRYQNKSIFIDHLYLQWHPSALLNKQVSIEKVTIDNLKITWPAVEAIKTKIIHKPPSGTELINQLKAVHQDLTSLHLPFYLQIKQGTINHLAIGQKKQEFPLQAEKMHVSGILMPNTLQAEINGSLTQPYQAQIKLIIQGSAQNYHLQLSVNNPKNFWVINSQVSKAQIQIDTNKALILGGEVDAHLVWQWQAQAKWQLSFKGRHLDVSAFKPNWPRPVDIQLNTEGYLRADHPYFTWNGTLNTPQTQIATAGKRDSQWDLKWNIKANQLAELIPFSSGSLQSIGELHGQLADPLTSGHLQGKLLRWQDYRVDKIDANWNVDASQLKNSTLILTAEQVLINGWQIPKLNVTAQGKIKNHQVNLKISAFNTDAQLELDGGIHADHWEGALNKLIITAPYVGSWQLSHPTSLYLSTQKINIAPLCLQNLAKSQFCFKGGWEGVQNAWEGAIDGKINLQQLITFLPESWNLNLLLDVHAIANGMGKIVKAGELSIKSGQGTVRYSSPEYEFQSIIKDTALTAKLNNKGLVAHWQLDLENQNSLIASINFPGVITTDLLRKDQALQGQLHLQLNDLSPLVKILPQEALPRGKFLGNFIFSGTLARPQINGSASLEKGEIKIPGLNIQLNMLDLSVQTIGPLIKYKLSALSDKQPISLTGETDISQPGFPTQANFSGNNVLLGDTSRFIVHLSPDVNIHLKGRNIDLSGNIDIPLAKVLQLEFYQETTLPEGEVVFVGEQPFVKKIPWNITTQLTINLGNNVTIDTTTLKSRLTGSITLISQPGQVLIAEGRIDLVGGTYTTSGRELTITPDSSVNYRRNPIDNPSLSLQAVTKVIITDALSQQQLGTNELTVGMNVGGTAKNPQITLFSSAGNLSQADMLSYLLLGTSSSGISPYNMNLLLQALNNLPLTKKGASGVEGITTQIKQTLGFNELGVESGETTFGPTGEPIPTSTPTSYFVVGKKITPHLYFRYRYDPFNSVNLFQLSYLFSKNWSVQVESDAANASGIDVLYTVETGSPKTAEKPLPGLPTK